MYKKLPLMAALLVAGAPAPALAQACIGVPVADGRTALRAAVAFTEGATDYGIGATANLVGPFTFEGDLGIVALDDVDSDALRFRLGGAMELPYAAFSACPVAGIRYTTYSESADLFGTTVETDVSMIQVPVGFGIGKSFPASPSLDVTAFAIPQFLYTRATIDVSGGGGSGGQTDSSGEFGLDVGLSLSGRGAFASGSVALTTIDNSEPTFGLRVGIFVP